MSSTVASAQQFIDRSLATRQVNKVLHSFPTPRLWQEERVPVVDLLARRRASGQRRDVAVYVGMPYCIRTEPDRCGYCLFPVEVYRGNKDLEVYFSALQREGELYRGSFEGDRVTNVYFGGGTANLYRPEMYPKLMDMVRGVFEVPAHVSVTLEGIPQVFSKEKLDAIKASGMNRVSIGVQQMDDELNRLSGRKQTLQHTFDVLTWCEELGLPCNVDLIFGWPRQTVASMVKGLEMLIERGVHHITHYELNVGGPTDFALNRRHELPSVAENLEMYRVSRELLSKAGYRQLTPYDWEKLPSGDKPLYEECKHDFRVSDLFGWGYAAVSGFEGFDCGHAAWSARNHTSVAEYHAAIERNEVPVERGFFHADVDLRLSELFRVMQSMRVDLDAYEQAFGVDLVAEHAPSWEALEQRGWVVKEGRTLRLVGDGVFYLPLIQTLLSVERIRELSRTLQQRSGKLPIVES